VHGASAASRVIYIMGIDPHQQGSLITQVPGGLFRKKGMIFKIRISSPMNTPVCVYQYGLSFYINFFEVIRANRLITSVVCMNN
jgi:hypothetical protein